MDHPHEAQKLRLRECLVAVVDEPFDLDVRVCYVWIDPKSVVFSIFYLLLKLILRQTPPKYLCDDGTDVLGGDLAGLLLVVAREGVGALGEQVAEERGDPFCHYGVQQCKYYFYI